MKQDVFETSNVEEEEQRTALQSTTSFLKEAACSLSVSVLVSHCQREIDTYRRGEPWIDAYGLELLRRATVQGDQAAWIGVQHCFSGLVHSWLCHHSMREIACRLESEENYVVQTFERFWQATNLNQQLEFNSLAAALKYLRASLNGVILDTLRTYARPREVPLPESGEGWEPHVEDNTDSSEVWETLQTMLSNERELRLAYLLFHCGLKPREIIRFCPQEWGDVQEIYRIRHNIMERLLHNADQLCWRLN